MRVLFLVVAVLAVDAIAQEESVTVQPPPFTARASGEVTVFILDGGCMCQPVSRIPAPPYSCNGACAVQRARSRNALADAIDGGALNQ